MLGSICGDVIGSPYEFGKMKDYNFELIVENSRLTDDSFMTAAVAAAIIENKGHLNHLDSACENQYRIFAKNHPDAGYGGMFKKWVFENETNRLMSWGNGSAMRVSPVGWAYSNADEVIEAARLSAIPTHGSPEGIRGACAVALCVFMARNGSSHEEIKKEIEERFYYDLNEPIKKTRKWYEFDVSCQLSVPVAIRAYLESSDFEDAVRLAVSVGGDSDTIGAMTGAIAEAEYGVPDEIKKSVLPLMSDDVANVYKQFYEMFIQNKLNVK